MKTQSTNESLFLLIAILVTILALGTFANAFGQNSSPSVEGTWLVQVQVADAPPGFPVPFDALETYSRGGGLVTSNNNPLIPRPGQGSWTKNGNEYSASIIFFFFNPLGTPIGTVEVTHRFNVAGEGYTGTGEAHFKNLNGDPLFPDHPQPFTFTSRGSRLAAVSQ